MTDVKCNICNSADCQPFSNEFFKNSLLRCLNCGLIFVYPQPDGSKLKEIYSQNYFKNNDSNSIGYEDYSGDKDNIARTFAKRLTKIEQLYPSKGKILDLGCALGFFLEAAADSGWQTWGVEISEFAAKAAKKNWGDKITSGTLNQACFDNDFFDIITMWDYLEHVSNPAAELALARTKLKKDGLLILSTPDAASLPHKLFKNRWMGYKDQEHLFYFSAKNLKILLEKAGFEIIKAEKIGKYVNANLFIKRLSLYNKFLANILKFLINKTSLGNLSLFINPLDIICIYAQKQ